VKLGQERDKVLETSPQSVNRPGYDHVELALGSVTAERIERGPFVSLLGAADAMVLVDLHDLAAHAAGDLAQLAFLVGRCLVKR
jgi:hypothetical protein